MLTAGSWRTPQITDSFGKNKQNSTEVFDFTKLDGNKVLLFVLL